VAAPTWNSTIELLADGEAEWRERAIYAEAQRNAYRLLSRSAIHALRAMTVDRDRLRVRLNAARAELRQLRRAPVSEAA
jgi:hypothetical protein